MKFSIGSAKHHGDAHKPTAWGARGRGKVFDSINDRFSPNTIRYATETELSFINRIMPSGRVLDLGCGTGRLLMPLTADNAHEAFGLDISLSMLAALAEKMQAAGLRPRIANGSALAALPFGDETFDGILSFGMISHYVDWPAVLRRLVPHLKEGAPLLFDLSVVHPENDGFAAATNPSLGGFDPQALPEQLAGVGLELDRVVPQRFGGAMDATAGWLDAATMDVKSFGELHILTELFVERLLGDPTCFELAIRLDDLLRDLLAFRTAPIYRPAAPVLIVARRRGDAPASKDLPSVGRLHTQETAALALREALSGDAFADARHCTAFLRYLAVLDPLLGSIDGGVGAAKAAFGDAYGQELATVRNRFRRLADGHYERSLRANAFKSYRRFHRRLMSVRQRLS